MKYKVIVLALVLGLASALPRNDPKLTRAFRRSAGTGGSRLGVFGGTATTITKHPYLATVLESGWLYCGAAILSDSWILTTADCATVFSKSDLSVVTGSSDGVTGTTYSIKQTVTHPDYDEYSYSYNYGLIQVDGTFTWGSKVANVSLPSAQISDNTQFIVAGYGATESMEVEGSETSDNSLRQGKMKWLPSATCQSYYTDSWDDSQACVYNKGKVTLCDGDYGDPFVKDGVVYGVALGGAMAYYCTNAAWPVILANVYPVVDWIQEYTGATVA